jgi:hypothetical protein
MRLMRISKVLRWRFSSAVCCIQTKWSKEVCHPKETLCHLAYYTGIIMCLTAPYRNSNALRNGTTFPAKCKQPHPQNTPLMQAR